ncbi:MAG TPA: AAA family ATPase [Gaiellaceae bacterium]|nr:AAA family ATPase [Gaiellaceae bacterium]
MFRRSRWILLLLVLVGAVSMVALRTLEGPLYKAKADVILSPTDLASALAGLSAYVDPTQVDATEQSLASSPQLFASAAAHHPRAGSAAELQAATSVNKNGTTITFSSVSSTDKQAVEMANAVAETYPTWRASVSGTTLTKAIDQLRSQLARSPTGKADILSQLDRLRLLRTVNSGNVLLVEGADGAAKTRPAPLKDGLLGGFIGFFVALLVVGAREALDNRVRSEQEIEEVLGAPVLATIERLPRNLTPLVAVTRTSERYSDMYALLAASIARSREGEDRIVIAVTSAAAEEGKTTTAVNLAAALARRDEQVRLVDLDTRSPSIGRIFSIPKDAPGVDRALRRESPVESLLWDIRANGVPHAPRKYERATTTRTAVSNLQVLPMGTVASNDVTAQSGRVTEMIEALGEHTGYVVVDTPPALSLPNATELAEIVDIVVIVVRHGRTSRRDLESLRRLHRSWPDVEVQAVLVDKPSYDNPYAYYARG